MNKSALSGLIVLMSTVAMPARAATFEFPSESTSYSSYWEGSGIIPNGYRSAALYTGGDYISQTISGTGLAYVSNVSDTFRLYTSLKANANIGVTINGIGVGSFVIPSCGCSGNSRTLDQSLSFAPVSGNGTYTITFTLLGSIPGGGGSFAFYDGGTGTLTGGVAPVPEPAAWALLLAGFGAMGCALRARPRAVAIRFA